MAQPLKEAPPTLTADDAGRAIIELHQSRLDADDPDVAFFPVAQHNPVTEADVEEVLRYLDAFRRVDNRVVRHEVQHWAVLLAYLEQQRTRRARLRRLTLLTAAHHAQAFPHEFGPPLGLSRRQAAWNQRRRLLIEFGHLAPPAPVADLALQRWLAVRRAQLRTVADGLVDHRDTLCHLVADGRRQCLVEAIDGVGMLLNQSRPTPGLAAAISYAMYLLHQDGQPLAVLDPELRELLATGLRLRVQYEATVEAGRKP